MTASSSQLPSQLAMLRFVEPTRAPATIGNGGLGMQHGAIPVKDADTRFEERSVSGS
jgi:hypothetical protein